MANNNNKNQPSAGRISALTALVVVLMIACVAVGLLGYYSAGFSDWSKFDPAAEVQTGGKVDTISPGGETDYFGTEITNSAHVMLTASAAVASAETGTVSKTLTATVLPEDAPDKSVDWDVAWGVPLEGEPAVTDYVTVTPQSDGSNVATVTAHQGFEGATIYVTVTTRVGGFSATCFVTYDGAPTQFSFVYGDDEITLPSAAAPLKLSAGQTHSVELKLDNVLGAVGSKYGDFEIEDIQMLGRFNAKRQYIVNAAVKHEDEIVINLESPTFKELEYSGNSAIVEGDTITIDPSAFIDASIDGDVLKLTVKKSETSYKYPSSFPRTGTYVTYASPYVDPRSDGTPDNCVMVIIVKEKISGISRYLYVDPISTVTGISVSDSSISF